jgi:outer membrane protein assembly factor BamB
MKKRLIFLPLSVLFIFIMNVNAQDWPQFLGPDRNSHSDQKGIMRTWPENGPEVLWSVNVGIGFGGPAVKSGKVYLLDRYDEVGDSLRVFDLADGKELWSFGYSSPGSVSFPGSRGVPTIDKNFVYTVGQNGELYCIDINMRKPVWNKNIWKDFGGGEVPTWAIAQSPLIYGDLLIVASQAPEAGVVAYDKLTGDVKWKTSPIGNISYVSPSLAKIDGDDHVVMITGSSRSPGSDGKVVGIEPLTGRLLWEYSEWNCAISIPSAVDAGENRLLITGGYALGATMIKVNKNENGRYFTTELFTTEEFGDQTKTPLMHNGYFYAQYGTNNRRDGLVCMDMNGEIMWNTRRSPDFNKGSMVLADGLILATDGQNTLYLIEPDPSEYRQIASVEILREDVLEGDPAAARAGAPTQNWAPVALADGRLLIRNQSRMLCVQVSSTTSAVIENIP